MSGIKYLADTNCFIYLLDENPLLLPFASDTWAFSYITEIELLSKKGIASLEETVIGTMLDTCYRVDHSPILTAFAIELKKTNSIKLPDALIAASAKLMNLPLLTADKGFSGIKGIDCIILEL